MKNNFFFRFNYLLVNKRKNWEREREKKRGEREKREERDRAVNFIRREERKIDNLKVGKIDKNYEK